MQSTPLPEKRVAAGRRPIERVRGTQDSWRGDARALDAVRRRLEGTFARYGYERIDVPVIEPAELHLRKSGLEIVSKLYSFADLGGRQLCLRPELTASVARAYVARPPERLPAKVFSSGPVFRYERPSKGRYRQFVQTGIELIGATGPLADAETVSLAMDALRRAGLREYRVTIGHVGILGDLLTRIGLPVRLRTFLLESLEDSRRRGMAGVRQRLHDLDPELFEAGAPFSPDDAAAEPMDEAQARAAIAGLLSQAGADALGRRSRAEVVERLLRKLRPEAGVEAVERALAFMERLGAISGAPADVFAAGRALLAEYGLPDEPLRNLEETIRLVGEFGADLDRVRLDLGLSRGLQYYTGMVFEIDHAGLGSESQLCGGGRYDDLIRALGGKQPVPALGFSFGVERVKLALENEAGSAAGDTGRSRVFVVAASPEHVAYAARTADAVRAAGGAAFLEVTLRPLRTSLAYADREGFTHVAVAGDAEARESVVRLRRMAGGQEETVQLADTAALRDALSIAGDVDGD